MTNRIGGLLSLHSGICFGYNSTLCGLQSSIRKTAELIRSLGGREGVEKSSLIATTAAIIIIGIAMICTVSQNLVLLALSTFSLFPMIVSLMCAFLLPKPSCQGTLSVGSILYTAWMVFFVVYCFVISPGPLGPIAFLAGPIYSFPVLIIVWVVASMQNASGPKSTSTPPQDN